MKKFKLYFLTLIAITGFLSCDKEESDKLTAGAETGGLISVNSPLVGYVVGNGDTFAYEANFNVFQGAVKTTQVDVYKSFTNTSGDTSNETFLKTITIPTSPQSQDFTFTFSYNELIAGLLLNGNPLPASDALLNIGDSWTLRYLSTTSEGKTHMNAKTTKVAVGTRFAGVYKVVENQYWRIGVYRPDVQWIGETRVIESVNATTYKFNEFAGPFGPPGFDDNTHFFTIDASDVVRTPVSYNGTLQILNGSGVINCQETPGDIPNACAWPGPQNTVFRDDITGKDRIYRTYGYFTTGSGPREIYEVLEKVVD
jgi:hypothetical protein